MNDPDPAREAAILARCEVATPGPWDHKIPTDGATHELTRCVWAKALGIPVAQSLAHHDFPEDEGFIQEQALANAHFIAHAREDVPWLLAQLAAARERVRALEGMAWDYAEFYHDTYCPDSERHAEGCVRLAARVAALTEAAGRVDAVTHDPHIGDHA